MPITSKATIAVIGGTGLEDMAGLKEVQTIDVPTPYGKPSDKILLGKLDDVRVAFLPRHGRGHFISPTELPNRANIWALKSIGVEHIIAVCSCGSYKKEVAPGHLLIPDQLIDRTSGRVNTYFSDGIVAHVGFADPFCHNLRKTLCEAAQEAGATLHDKGTYVCMEGPAFSTRAESKLYKSWGADIIGMTALPEAKLAREAEICYAVIGCVTDYDCWWEPVEPVTVEVVLRTLRENINTAREVIRLAVKRIERERTCQCKDALQMAIVTDPAKIPSATKQKLGIF
ncbi:MAG TPA: S-methyl-5'-thioadenosine phosphorylase, partial [Dehalococcoidales bacterium]|nr:S-methyl-5'-thioadenosine phosphorylase [Dehalococcoidales bacterium]